MYLGAFLAGVLDVAILKTAVTLLTVALLLAVYRGRRGHTRWAFGGLARADLRPAGAWLQWGLAAFLVSEITCAVEIYLLYRPDAPLRLVHAYSSALGAALIFLGVFVALDRTALHYFDRAHACVLDPVCRGCPRRQGHACHFHTAYLLTLVFLLLMVVPLLFVPVRPLPADPADLALPFPTLNAAFDDKVVPLLEHWIPHWTPGTMCFALPEAMTLAEFRHLPLAAALLILLALAAALVRRAEWLSFVCACLAAGALGFAYMDAVLYSFVPHVYVGSLGHEIGELMGLLLLGVLLTRVARGPSSPPGTAGASSAAAGSAPTEGSATAARGSA